MNFPEQSTVVKPGRDSGVVEEGVIEVILPFSMATVTCGSRLFASTSTTEAL